MATVLALKGGPDPVDPRGMAEGSGSFVAVDCQVCGATENDVVYERTFETTVLGRVPMTLVVCRGCGFLFANPRPSRATLDAHYRHSAAASGAVWHAHGAGSRHDRMVAYRAGFVERLLGSTRARGRVLDIGCSEGDLLAALELGDWERVGLEPSESAARKARAKGLSIENACLERNDLPDGAFDLVTCVSVLEHVWDVGRAVQELARLTKPGGYLFIDVPDSTHPIAQITEFFSFEHLSHFSPGTLQRLVQSHGLRPLVLEQGDGAGLTLGMRKDGVAATQGLPVEDDRDRLREALARYIEERAEFESGVRRRFEELAGGWRRCGARVAVYGAGEHTQFLLDLVDFADNVVGLLDSDPAKHGREFLRWAVHAPEEAPALGVDAIVISSRPFQEEMAAAVAPLASEHGIEIVRCYEPSLAG